MHLKRMCILLLRDGMFYIDFIKSISSNVLLKTSVSLLIFCLNDLSIDLSGVLKSPTLIILLSISPFMSANVCFMYLGAPMLSAYIFTIVISSYWIDPLNIM